MGIDAERVRRRSAYVREQVRALRALRKRLTRQAFISDPYLPAAARYQFQTAIEGLIDLAFHLSAKLAQHAPQDAHDAFETMARQAVLNPSDTPAYHQMLRFRDRVVHGYLDVDNDQLYEMMAGKGLDDIEEVLACFEAAASPATGPDPP